MLVNTQGFAGVNLQINRSTNGLYFKHVGKFLHIIFPSSSLLLGLNNQSAEENLQKKLSDRILSSNRKISGKSAKKKCLSEIYSRLNQFN
jgi:hypothetical protein